MLGRLVHGSEQGGRCSRPKTLVKCGESKRLRLAGGVRAKGFFSEGIKLTGLHISLELTIPCLRIKGRIPSAKGGKFVGREFLNLFFNRFHFAHCIT